MIQRRLIASMIAALAIAPVANDAHAQRFQKVSAQQHRTQRIAKRAAQRTERRAFLYGRESNERRQAAGLVTRLEKHAESLQPLRQQQALKQSRARLQRRVAKLGPEHPLTIEARHLVRNLELGSARTQSDLASIGYKLTGYQTAKVSKKHFGLAQVGGDHIPTVSSVESRGTIGSIWSNSRGEQVAVSQEKVVMGPRLAVVKPTRAQFSVETEVGRQVANVDIQGLGILNPLTGPRVPVLNVRLDGVAGFRRSNDSFSRAKPGLYETEHRLSMLHEHPSGRSTWANGELTLEISAKGEVTSMRMSSFKLSSSTLVHVPMTPKQQLARANFLRDTSGWLLQGQLSGGASGNFELKVRDYKFSPTGKPMIQLQRSTARFGPELSSSPKWFTRTNEGPTQHFRAEDGSTFIIHPAGASGPKVSYKDSDVRSGWPSYK